MTSEQQDRFPCGGPPRGCEPDDEREAPAAQGGPFPMMECCRRMFAQARPPETPAAPAEEA